MRLSGAAVRASDQGFANSRLVGVAGKMEGLFGKDRQFINLKKLTLSFNSRTSCFVRRKWHGHILWQAIHAQEEMAHRGVSSKQERLNLECSLLE
jgi:hypothetical protein